MTDCNQQNDPLDDLIYEDDAFCIRRTVEDLGDGEGRRTVSVKTLANPDYASLDEAIQLNNEFNILMRALPKRNVRISEGCSIYAPLKRTMGPEGKTARALYLEDIKGVSLKEWINSNPLFIFPTEGSHFSLLNRARVAWGIAAALAYTNELGVVHNDVRVSNFMIEQHQFSKENIGCDVKIINFGLATLNNEHETNDSGQRVNNDLPSLGSVMRMLFVEGEGAANEESYYDLGFEFSDAGQDKAPNLSKYLPRSIYALLSNLISIDGKFGQYCNKYPYMSAREVEEDLEQMIENPDSFLFDPPAGMKLDVLRISPLKLYGRSEEIEIMKAACHRIAYGNKNSTADNDSVCISSDTITTNKEEDTCSGKSETIFVVASGGVGKSELVRRVCRPLIVDGMGGYFLQGKFDKVRKNQPYTGLVAAFTDFCDMVLARGDVARSVMAAKIQEAIGSQGKLLTDFMPNLVKIIGEQPTLSANMSGAKAQIVLRNEFKKFVRAISKPEHPVSIGSRTQVIVSFCSPSSEKELLVHGVSFFAGSSFP